MALTKEQVSLVTVSTLGVAAGGYTAQLAAFNTQKEAAAFIATTGLLNAGTNAEFVNTVAGNLNNLASTAQKAAFYKALEDGATRADAAVDFANTLLVSNGKIANVDKAIASTSTSTDLTALNVTTDAATNGLRVEFKDSNTDKSATVTGGHTVNNIGKAQIDANQGKISVDFTFALKNQIGEDATFTGNILSPILEEKPAKQSGSQVVLELRNLREDENSVTPLKDLPTNGFGFEIDGELVIVQSDAIDDAETYADLLTAVKDRIEELGRGENLPAGADAALYAKLATFNVKIGNTKFAEERDANTGIITKTHDVQVTEIILTDEAGATLNPRGYINREGIIDSSGFTLFAQMSDESGTSIQNKIATNLEADNVGYGSQGATVNLVGQSNSDKGIEELNVTATNGVWFTKLESQKSANTIDHLETINLVPGSEGYFRVGTQKNHDRHLVDLVNEDFTTAGLVDVQKLNAGAAGSVAVNSYVSEKALNRFDFEDTSLYTTDDDDALISYNLTSGADVVNLAISTQVLEAVDTQVKVNTGGGNDFITVQATHGLVGGKVGAAIEESGTPWLINQQLNNNIKIDAGDGDDWILTPGAGNATILAGAGNDVVRVDNAGDRGVFVFNNATTDVNELIAGSGFNFNQGLTSNSDNDLSSGANTTPQTYNFFKAQVQVSFKGFESAFVLIESTNYQTTTKQINQAIKKAVNTDPVLNKLIAAMDNEGNALAIESLIDGLLTLGELDISIIPPVTYSTTETAAAKATREEAGQLMLANGEEAKADTALNLTAGTTAANMAAAATAAELLYFTEFATSSTGANPFAALPAVADGGTGAAVAYLAGTDAVSTITVGTAANGSETALTVGGLNVFAHYAAVLPAPTDANTTAAAVAAALTAAKTADEDQTIAFNAATVPLSAITIGHTAPAATVTLTVDADWITDYVSGGGTAPDTTGPVIAFTGGSGVATSATVVHADATEETQTITFTGAPAAAGTITVGGVAVTLDGTEANATAVAAKVVAALTAGTTVNGEELVTAATNVAGVVTIEYPASAGDVNAITVSQAGVNVYYDGGISLAESDNVVDLGAGQDVLTLGTGTLSNDTVLVKEYNLGHKTIVNFTQNSGTAADGTNGEDLLDFTNYLSSVDANGARVATTVATMSGTATGNAVQIVDYLSTEKLTTASTAVITFDKLSAGDVLNMIKNDDAASGVLNIDLAGGGAASLTQNYVLMVHNKHATAGNEGEYKAFHVTSKGNSDEAATVQLIGTFDFGDVAGTSVLAGIDATNFA